LDSIKKIDIHTHISSDAPYLRELMDSLNLKFTTLTTSQKDLEFLNVQAKRMIDGFPRYYAWVTTFSVTGINEPGWSDKVIAQLKKDFDNGAIGVKLWKIIGMEIKNVEGEFIQVDDPVFTPIFQFIADQEKTVIAHIGEPIQAWMPTWPSTDDLPGTYWEKHPEYSFWQRPDLPSYSEIIAARDRVLGRHPDLRFVGAHLGSLEFDVDEIAKRLEAYPNFAVDIGGRTRYLMWQARGKVREFFIKYQDRIMYGTDRGGGLLKPDGSYLSQEELELSKRSILARHRLFSTYYATDNDIHWGNYVIGDDALPYPTYVVKSLDLPENVLTKIFYQNAVDWFPGVDNGY
jgi:predicted TIM-barrel fold metal-dependent hydrolase